MTYSSYDASIAANARFIRAFFAQTCLPIRLFEPSFVFNNTS